MIAAAETIAAAVEGRFLAELHGLDDKSLSQLLDEQIGAFESTRSHCRKVCFEALHAAFSDYRALQLEEFQGEKALICTCFGVAEETIEHIIAENSVSSVEEVGDFSHAGTGCGSCRMLIQELIDQSQRSTMAGIRP